MKVDFLRWFGMAAAGLLLSARAAGQEEVCDEIRQAEAEIARIDKLIGDTRKEQGTTLGHLKLVGTKLENRQKIVRGIESEMGTVSGQLQTKSAEVFRLQNRSDELKHSYSALIRIAYKNHRNNSFLSFVFSARDFTDAARRLYYVKRIGEDIRKKADEIRTLNKKLDIEVASLNGRKKELAELQERHTAEVARLQEERGQLKKTQDALRGKEEQLLAEAEKRRGQIAELERQLQRAVSDEVKKSGGTAVSEPLTAQFAAKKGKLLRPVDGVVVDRYGLHNHPTQKGVKINNKGVNIAAKAGGEVRCVFAGEVRKVFFFQGLGMSVMVRHGAYLTIYANLESVFVREGEKVMEESLVGTVAKAASGQQATLHFEVWKESDNLNPELWIRK
ncbi:peptidoglycan DD-metalloendopeptidase family protein [uncultured Rikenella sp.]|uniref:murein hydrolase activator EnvC family protein n=1 Tax=uncultured Rikenella sp. TaxID=368003 RepID=UPI00260A6D61|nr:peptidoglycan DD-metalloendopeptidase family protein [uncultured Rikenella sp.]